jgi:hypothetical protein
MRPSPHRDSAQLLFLELNEVNFEFVHGYVRGGRLPAFRRLFEKHGYLRTESEQEYAQLEPWIQWVTAHTGKSLSEHGVFRLGDIVNHDIPQIWEQLEAQGLRVGALSPMNAKNRLRAPAFFVPDPWTRTAVAGRPVLQALYRAIVQAVDDSAEARVSAGSVVNLLRGFLAYAPAAAWPSYAALAFGSRGRPWRRALFLDRLLADVFSQEVKRTRPQFASLFLNAGAHIQHHYLFSSPIYRGGCRNPGWYLAEGLDPLFEVYELYDGIIDRVMRQFPAARVMIGTGLHQEPHEKVTYYWRLRDHASFLKRIGVVFDKVEPRMSRDFLVVCSSAESARAAQKQLDAARAADGLPLFEVDNRGADLFVMLTYPREITAATVFNVDGREFRGLFDDVVFVALKNGEHDGIGYFLDTGAGLKNPAAPPIPLREVPSRIQEALLGVAGTAS